MNRMQYVIVSLTEGRLIELVTRVNLGFQATQRRQRKERNEMTSLLDSTITAVSDDGVCRWHAAKLRQTRQKI